MATKYLAHPGPCSHCGSDPKLKRSSAHIYNGRNFGAIWECQCGARVGCHKGTGYPLGTVADEPTQRARKRAHAAFDQLWKSEHNERMTRYEAYKWLRDTLGLSMSKAHIAMLSTEQCELLIAALESREVK